MSGIRFSLIDETNIEDHTRLSCDDKCFFLYEYTPREGFSFSDTNSLILNLKKKPSIKHRPEYRHKRLALQRCSALLRDALAAPFLSSATLVPVPPSKARDHPDYDDRVEQICRGIGPNVDVRPLVRQNVSMEAAHMSGAGPRPTIDDLLFAYEIDESHAVPDPISIGIVDDVLTAGTHFKAVQQVLTARFPQASIYGIFIARRVLPARDASAFFAAIDDDRL